MKFALENNIFGVCLNCCVYCADERHQSHKLILYLVKSKILWRQLRLAPIPFPAIIFKGGAILGSFKACIPAGAEYRTHIFSQGGGAISRPLRLILISLSYSQIQKLAIAHIKNKRK